MDIENVQKAIKEIDYSKEGEKERAERLFDLNSALKSKQENKLKKALITIKESIDLYFTKKVEDKFQNLKLIEYQLELTTQYAKNRIEGLKAEKELKDARWESAYKFKNELDKDYKTDNQILEKIKEILRG